MLEKVEEHWPQTVTLSINERMWLLGLLPRQGDIATVRRIRELREDLDFDDNEEVEFKIVRGPSGGFQDFDHQNKTTKDFDLGRLAFTLIKETFQKLDREKKLPLECIDLYTVFCEEKKVTEAS